MGAVEAVVAGAESTDKTTGRKAAALGTAQRNLTAALLVSTSFGDPEILVMTLVAYLG